MPFSLGYALYSCEYKYKRLEYRYSHFKITPSVGTAPVLNSLLEKRLSICSSFKALCIDTSCIKIGICYQTIPWSFSFHVSLV